MEGFAARGPFSIDLVTEASVNRNLYEEAEEDDNEEEDDMKLSEAKLEDLLKENPALVEAIKAEARKDFQKELGEEIKKGKGAEAMLAQGEKLIALAESGLPAELTADARKAIEPEAVNLETAKTIIESYKRVAEKLAKPGSTEPAVHNNGKSQDDDEQDVTEGALETKLAEALK